MLINLRRRDRSRTIKEKQTRESIKNETREYDANKRKYKKQISQIYEKETTRTFGYKLIVYTQQADLMKSYCANELRERIRSKTNEQGKEKKQSKQCL